MVSRYEPPSLAWWKQLLSLCMLIALVSFKYICSGSFSCLGARPPLQASSASNCMSLHSLYWMCLNQYCQGSLNFCFGLTSWKYSGFFSVIEAWLCCQTRRRFFFNGFIHLQSGPCSSCSSASTWPWLCHSVFLSLYQLCCAKEAACR